MAKTPGTQLVAVVLVEDVYRWQHCLEQPQSHFSSAKCSRNWGMIMSPQGW
jgi:hypothetical protein